MEIVVVAELSLAIRNCRWIAAVTNSTSRCASVCTSRSGSYQSSSAQSFPSNTTIPSLSACLLFEHLLFAGRTSESQIDASKWLKC